jgi:L-lactate dehydrogenase complex protein LldF
MQLKLAENFPTAAAKSVADTQVRKNVRHATRVITTKRDKVVAEQADWERLRESASKIRVHTLRHQDTYLQRFESNCTAAGGTVHWAADAADARRIVVDLVRATNSKRAIKIKSMTSEEIALNTALESAGIETTETDLAELIIQLGKDSPSHLVVPALHKNRQQIREIFRRELNLPNLGEQPADLADAARRFLREKFLHVDVAVGGANFLPADTGGVCIVESEGNGRMCLTLPKTLIVVAGIDKVIPRFSDLSIFLQLLPRSATGERMNPYNSVWTGVHPGDGPTAMHVVLLDNGRSSMLADGESRQTLHCIRCGACQNVCPVYKQTGGHAYGSVYAGPIGAILAPQLVNSKQNQSLPYASSLCGACYDVCPVKINIPEVLIHLRSKVVRGHQSSLIGMMDPENIAMQVMAKIFASDRRLRAAQRLGRIGQWPFVNRRGWIDRLPGMLAGWTQVRDLRPIPKESFREWWDKRDKT